MPGLGDTCWGPAARAAATPAGWRKGRSVFGYKAHVAVDAGSGLIRAAVLTPANIHDSAMAEQLIQGDEATAHAGRGYDQAARRARLPECGIADRITRRAQRNTSPAEAAAITTLNRLLAPLRAPVKQVFAIWQQW